MTHTAPATFTHPTDPPMHPNVIGTPWENKEVEARLIEMWPDHSATKIAAALLDEFQITVTRSQIIGKASRLGIAGKPKLVNTYPKVRQPPRVKLRVVRSSGNSTNLKLAYSVETDMPALRCVAVEPLNLTLADLPDNGCRYIAGDDHLYCGHPQREKSSYCAAHHMLVWTPAPPRKPNLYKARPQSVAGGAIRKNFVGYGE